MTPGNQHSNPAANTFIVGAAKTGTTALAQHLSGHPAIFVSNPKEPFYLSETDLPGLAEQHDLATDDDYFRLFASATDTPIRIDASTTTLRSSAAQKLAEDLTGGTGKYIVGLRRPDRLAHAFHSEQVFQLNETEPDFATAWAGGPQRRDTTDSYELFRDYAAVAQIGTQLEQLLTQVDRDRVLIYVQEELTAEPTRLYRDVLEFLELPFDGRATIERANGNRAHRFPALAKLVLDPPTVLARPMRAARAQLNASPNGGVRWVKAKLRPPTERTELDEAFVAELQQYFASEVEIIERILGRKIEAWHQ